MSELESIIAGFSFPETYRNIDLPEVQVSDSLLDGLSFLEKQEKSGREWVPRTVLESMTGVPARLRLEIIKRDTNIHLLLCRYLDQVLSHFQTNENVGDLEKNNQWPDSKELRALTNDIIMLSNEDTQRFEKMATSSLKYAINTMGSPKSPREPVDTINLFSSPSLPFSAVVLNDPLPQFSTENNLISKEHDRIKNTIVVYESQEERLAAVADPDGDNTYEYEENVYTEVLGEYRTSIDPVLTNGSPMEEQVLMWQRSLTDSTEVLSMLWTSITEIINKSRFTIDNNTTLKVVGPLPLSSIKSSLEARDQASSELASCYPDYTVNISKWLDITIIDPTDTIRSIAEKEQSHTDSDTDISPDPSNSFKRPYSVDETVWVAVFHVSEIEFFSVILSTDSTGIDDKWRIPIRSSSWEVIRLLPLNITLEPSLTSGAEMRLWYDEADLVEKSVTEAELINLGLSLSRKPTLKSVSFSKLYSSSAKDEIDRRESIIYRPTEVTSLTEYNLETIEDEDQSNTRDENRPSVRKMTPDIETPEIQFIRFGSHFKERHDQSDQSCSAPSLKDNGVCSNESVPIVKRVAGKLRRCCEKIKPKDQYDRESYIREYNYLRRKAWYRLIGIYNQMENDIASAAKRISGLKRNITEDENVNLSASLESLTKIANIIMRDVGYCMDNQKDPQCANLYEFLNEILVAFHQHEKGVQDLNKLVTLMEYRTTVIQTETESKNNVWSGLLSLGRSLKNFAMRNAANLSLYNLIGYGVLAVPLVSGLLAGFTTIDMSQTSALAALIPRCGLIVTNMLCEVSKNPVAQTILFRTCFRSFLWFVNNKYATKIFSWVVQSVDLMATAVPGLSTLRALFVVSSKVSTSLVSAAVSLAKFACNTSWVNTGIIDPVLISERSKVESITTLFVAFQYYFSWVFDIGSFAVCTGGVGIANIVAKSINAASYGWNTLVGNSNLFQKVTETLDTFKKVTDPNNSISEARHLVDTHFKTLDPAPGVFTRAMQYTSRADIAFGDAYGFQPLPYIVPVFIVIALLFAYRTASKTIPTPSLPRIDPSKWEFKEEM